MPFSDLLRISRPLLWLNTAVLWVLALLVLEQPPTGADLLMIGYFTFPFNLWLHGINDVYDHESDLLNARKGGDEGARVPRAYHATLLRQVVLWNAPFWLLALWQGNATAVALLALFVLLGWAYSAPPIRGKSRPGLDSLINSAYALPFLIALAWHGAAPATWHLALPALLAFALWGVASHAFTSIQDIEPDRAAGIRTIATFLGARRSALLALVLYLLALLLVARYGWPWTALIAVYPLLVLRLLAAPDATHANRLYRFFIGYNSLVGFLVTATLALASPANTLWAAGVLLGLVVVVGTARGKSKVKGQRSKVTANDG